MTKTMKIKLTKIREDGTATGRFWGQMTSVRLFLDKNLIGESIITFQEKFRGNREYIIDHDPKIGEWEEYTYYVEDAVMNKEVQ